MKPILPILAVLAVGVSCGEAVHAGGSAPRAAASAEEEVAIELSAVPAAAVAAATAKLPGIAFTSAEREVEGGVTLYCLTGTLKGKRYEVEVTADGKVVEVEDEADDDDDDGEDDDHDD